MGGEEMSTLGGNGVGQKWGEEGDGTKGKKSVGRESRVERKGSEKGEGTGSEEATFSSSSLSSNLRVCPSALSASSLLTPTRTPTSLISVPTTQQNSSGHQ